MSEPYDDSGNPYEPPPPGDMETVRPERFHSVIGGVASFVCGVAALLLLLFSLGVRSGTMDWLFVGAIFFSMAGLGLGFPALKTRRRHSAIMGILFSASVPLSLLFAFLSRFF